MQSAPNHSSVSYPGGVAARALVEDEEDPETEYDSWDVSWHVSDE